MLVMLAAAAAAAALTPPTHPTVNVKLHLGLNNK